MMTMTMMIAPQKGLAIALDLVRESHPHPLVDYPHHLLALVLVRVSRGQ